MKNALIAITLAVMSITAAGSTAHAAPTTSISAALDKESDCQRAKRQGKACQITFGTGDDIDGALVSPDGDDVYGMMNAFFGGLIELRLDFRSEIIAALDRF
jgi:hypothetical protein